MRLHKWVSRFLASPTWGVTDRSWYRHIPPLRPETIAFLREHGGPEAKKVLARGRRICYATSPGGMWCLRQDRHDEHAAWTSGGIVHECWRDDA